MRPYYVDPAVTIWCGNAMDIVPELAPSLVGCHVITDPPYSAETHATHAKGREFATWDTAPLTFDSIRLDDLRAMMLLLPEMRWWVSTMDHRHVAALVLDPVPYWRFVRMGVWVKPGSMPQVTGDRPAMGYEAVAIMHGVGQRMRWNGGGRPAVWTYPPVRGEHPTQKPLRLLTEWIGQFTDPGDTILDPFMGSGTTLRAAKDLGRYAVGIEVNPEYCELAAQRMSQQVLPIEGV